MYVPSVCSVCAAGSKTYRVLHPSPTRRLYKILLFNFSIDLLVSNTRLRPSIRNSRWQCREVLAIRPGLRAQFCVFHVQSVKVLGPGQLSLSQSDITVFNSFVGKANYYGTHVVQKKVLRVSINIHYMCGFRIAPAAHFCSVARGRVNIPYMCII